MTTTPSGDQNHTFRRYEDDDHDVDAWDEVIFQAGWSHKCPTYINKTPPCQGSCPSGHDIRGWLQIVRQLEKPTGDMDWQRYAFNRATDANPFPSMMGRVCPAPCEDGCNRNQVEDFVGINAVEQFIGDYAIEHGFEFEKCETTSDKKIAIIGGGPAGLAAAFQLRKLGHACTIFDDHEELGGMMRYGIPSYRTPRDTLDGEIQRIINMGVDVKLKTRVGKDVPMDDVEKEFDAIIWALGAKSGRPLPVPGADAPNCLSGVAFLEAFNEKRLQIVAKKVVVVGGGDTSIDVVSVARRLGHITEVHEKDSTENVVLGFTAHDVASTVVREGSTVTLTSLFPIENMTAAEHEVEDALREGVSIKGSVMPLEVMLDSEGRATGLRCCECTLDGNRPVATEGTEFTIEADIIVSAIGQSGDLTGLESMDNGHGFINSDKFYQVPDKPGHFLAGDIVRPHLLTTAIGQAAIAVESVQAYLDDQELSKRPKVDVHHFDLLHKLSEWNLSPEEHEAGESRGTSEENFAVHNYDDRSAAEIIPHDDLFLGHYEETPRHKRDTIAISSEEVLGNFTERLVGYEEAAAIEEAGRCMSCGMCFECDNCVIFCPQDAVKKTPKAQSTTGRYVYTDYSRCIGCHICADVCPTGYINMGLGE
ncbi:MAG: NAD(P)-binding protein [Methylococcales bacterium]|jgi:glutamate synthase (NADPH) small chain|nr:NAD(P)-binding protein [Methylococcales bacterium]MBT7444100.1 NAD(P)-binding protein [Methylococcales bacterium]